MALLILGTVSHSSLLSAEVVEGNQVINEFFMSCLENTELSHNLEEVGILEGVHCHILQMSNLRLQAVSSISYAVRALLSSRVILSIPHQVLRVIIYFC
jgi:hypothetical protein